VADADPYRPIPVDFAGPICFECLHAWPQGERDNGHNYVCLGFEPKVVRPAERNPITGEVHDAWIQHAYCREQNDQGQCERFVPKPTPFVQIRPTRGVWYRRLVGQLGASLVEWAKGKNS
jgi:hypothetical protein